MSASSISPNPQANASAARTRRAGDRLYAWFALLAGFTIFAGFARTLYLRSMSGAPPLSTLLLVHGIVMTTWFVVFGMQVWLIEAQRPALHRRLGVVGLVAAVCVVYVGMAAAIDAGRRGVGPAFGVSPQVFMAIPLFDMPMFALLVGVALWNRRRPAIHGRLMLLATLGILTPAIGRIPLGVIQHGGPPVFFGLALMIILACIVADTVRNRRLHPAFAWGGALIVAMLPLRLFIASTAAWTQFASWLVV